MAHEYLFKSTNRFGSPNSRQGKTFFETDPCVFCSSFPETLEHLFIVALFTSKFKWLSMKINNILSTVLEDILLLSILVY